MKNILPIAFTLLIAVLRVSAVDAQVPYQPQTYYVANLSATSGEDCGAYYSVTPMPAVSQGQPQAYYIANLSSTDGANCGEYVTVTPQPQITYPMPTLQMPVQFMDSSSGVDRSMSDGEPDPNQ